MYEKSKPEMLDKLMKTTTLTGRPSVYLQEMMNIADRINVGDDMVRHKFIHSLPPSISTAVATQKNSSLQELGKLADELMPYIGNNHYQAAMNVNTSRSSGHQQNNNSNRNKNNNSVPYGLRPFNESQRPKVCRGHIFYGKSSKTCKEWCQWPSKNNVKILPNSRPSSPAPSRASSPGPSNSEN